MKPVSKLAKACQYKQLKEDPEFGVEMNDFKEGHPVPEAPVRMIVDPDVPEIMVDPDRPETYTDADFADLDEHTEFENWNDVSERARKRTKNQTTEVKTGEDIPKNRKATVDPECIDELHRRFGITPKGVKRTTKSDLGHPGCPRGPPGPRGVSPVSSPGVPIIVRNDADSDDDNLATRILSKVIDIDSDVDSDSENETLSNLKSKIVDAATTVKNKISGAIENLHGSGDQDDYDRHRRHHGRHHHNVVRRGHRHGHGHGHGHKVHRRTKVVHIHHFHNQAPRPNAQYWSAPQVY